MRFDAVGKRYGGRVALAGISFTLAEGESVAITGVNGAGKTTLLRCLLDFAYPDSGVISIFGVRSRDPRARSRLAFVPERFQPPAQLTGHEVLQWLMFQMGSVGPMFGQVHHFRRFAPGPVPYAIERFGTEARRLYGVLDRRLGEAEYLAGDYSIADIASWPWVSRYEWHQVDITAFPNVLRWYRSIAARPAVQKGYQVPKDAGPIPMP